MKVILGDWLMNAGIIGYLRMRKLAGREIPDLSKGFIEIESSDLDSFTEWYFTHVLMKVVEVKFRLRTNIPADLRSKLDAKQFVEFKSKFGELGKNSFERIKVDYNNFDATLQSVIETFENLERKVTEFYEIELSKLPDLTPKDIERTRKKINEDISKDIKSLRDRNLNFLYTYLNSFYKNKNVIANPASKARKRSFRSTYVEPAARLLDSSVIATEGFLCRFCKQNRVVLAKFDDVNSIFAEGMFSTTALTIQFRNFFYNMQPDLFVCDVCELLLISAWAGFTEIPYRFRDKINDTNYIFVNLPSLELLWEENERIQNLYASGEENLQGTIYQDIIQDIFLSKHKMKAKWALQNTLFIEIKTTSKKHLDRPDFRYFHVGEYIASLFTDEYAANAFRYIEGRVEMGNGLEVNLRRNVVSRTLDHDSLFPICYSLMVSHLEGKNKYALRNVFNISLISSIRASIAAGIGSDGGCPLLESKQIYGILRGIQNEGSNFTNIDYDVRKRKSYILLSMIRNGRIEDFYDILIKIYMSQNKPVPDTLVGLLNKEDEIGFQARAYAFMSGFLGEKN